MSGPITLWPLRTCSDMGHGTSLPIVFSSAPDGGSRVGESVARFRATSRNREIFSQTESNIRGEVCNFSGNYHSGNLESLATRWGWADTQYAGLMGCVPGRYARQDGSVPHGHHDALQLSGRR